MKSLLNTSPLSRKLWSASRHSSACRKLPHTVGTSDSSSGSRSYRFLSIGSPGWILFWTPSRPAISIAAKPRYGLQVGSGKRTSMRRPFGLDTYGMRIDAERLRAEYARLIGASKPGTRRLYEFGPGLV